MWQIIGVLGHWCINPPLLLTPVEPSVMLEP
jgi:hypothetical protein